MSSQFRNKDHSNSDSDGEEEKKKKDFKERAEFSNHLKIKDKCETKMNVADCSTDESLLVGTDKPKNMLVPEDQDPGENEKFSFDEAKTVAYKPTTIDDTQRSFSYTYPSEKDSTSDTKVHQIRRVRTESENEKLTGWIRTHKNKKVKASLKEDSSLRRSVDHSGRTLLHISAACGNVTATNYLLDIFDADARDSNGRTALMLAVEQNHANVVRMLLPLSDTDVLDNDGKDVFHFGFAKKETTTKVVDLLLHELFKKYESIETIAEKLVSSGCQLHQAVRVMKIELIQSMLARGVDVDAADPETKYTALHISAILHEPEIAKVLLEAGADADALDDQGLSPLFHNYLRPRTFEKRNQLEILDVLLARRASLTATTERGMFQVSTTLMNGCAEAIARLLRSGYLDFGALDSKDGSRAIHYLAMNCNRGVVQQLKLHAAGYDYHLNASDRRGFVALHTAVRYRNVAMLQFLLEQGVDANHLIVTSNVHKFTPIYLCIKEPALLARECLEVLLQHKADPQACLTDGDGEILLTLFDLEHRTVRLRPIVAHLALIEKQGESIVGLILGKIHSRAEIRKYFERCQATLDMKLFGSIAVLNLLADSENKVMGYLNNEKLRLKLKRLSQKPRIYQTFSYYFNTLRKRVVKLLQLKGLRDQAAGVVCEWFEDPIDGQHIAIQRLLDFLDASSLELLTSL